MSDADKMPPVDYFGYYIEAFNDLSTCRAIGMGVGPIPFTAIYSYARMYNISDGDEFEEFQYLIRLMDNEYLILADKKTAPKESASGKGRTGKRNKGRVRR